MSKTNQQYKKVIANCRSIFEKKSKDYGTSWRILRIISLTDQIFMKGQRIRIIAIVNYCAMGLIQLDLGHEENLDIEITEALKLYDEKTELAFNLMQSKNHDYGEAWRDMRISSLTDLIMMKILRTKQIEDNKGKTLISEGIDANYLDMLNYAVFALIRISEAE